VRGLQLFTVLSYDRDSDRVVKSEEYLNGQLRTTRTPQPEQQDSAGRTLLPVTVVPFWGLASTQTFVLGEPLGRPEMVFYENGRTVRVTDWFSGTAVPRVSETRDRHGNLIERSLIKPGSLADLDLVTRYKVGRSGIPALVGEDALIIDLETGDQLASLDGVRITAFIRLFVVIDDTDSRATRMEN